MPLNVTDSGQRTTDSDRSEMNQTTTKQIMDIVDLVKKTQEIKRRQAQASASLQSARKSIQQRKQFITKHASTDDAVARF